MQSLLEWWWGRYFHPRESATASTAGRNVSDIMSAARSPKLDRAPNCFKGTMAEVHRDMNDAMVVSPAMITGRLTRVAAVMMPDRPAFPSSASENTFSRTWMP